jgi:hypothetical protein
MVEQGERRERALTPADIEEIKSIACTCPHGMTAQDVFRLREFLGCWEKAKSSVGGYVIKTFIVLIIAIGVLVTWITNR